MAVTKVNIEQMKRLQGAMIEVCAAARDFRDAVDSKGYHAAEEEAEALFRRYEVAVIECAIHHEINEGGNDNDN